MYTDRKHKIIIMTALPKVEQGKLSVEIITPTDDCSRKKTRKAEDSTSA